MKNLYGSGPILAAVGTADVKMLRLLTSPKAEGGFGLSVHALNYADSGPIEIAVINEQVDMLDILTRDTNRGGYGFILNNIENLLNIAKEYSCVKSICWLVEYLFNQKLESQGYLSVVMLAETMLDQFPDYRHDLKTMFCQRYKMLLTSLLKKSALTDDEISETELIINTMNTMSGPDSNTFEQIFMWEFNRKLHDHHCKVAINWALSLTDNNTLIADLISSVLCQRLLKLISDYSMLPKGNLKQLSDITTVIDAIDALSPGTGTLHFAKICLSQGDFINAYACYSSVYANPSCSNQMKQAAGFELANLIFNELVPLENENKEVDNSILLQKRAAQAGLYLVGNSTFEGVRLKQYFDRIQSGDHQLQGCITTASISTVSIFTRREAQATQQGSDNNTLRVTI